MTCATMQMARLPLTQPAPALRHLLLVEDEPGDVQMVREAIGMRPIRIHVAEALTSAFHFLERIGEFSDAATPNLVLLDIRLPVFPGTILLQERRQRHLWTGIPVVVFTSSELERRHCLELGATDYVRKPATWSGWQLTIDSLIERFLS